MIPTVDQVKTRFRALLDDPNGRTFSDAVFTEAFGEAYDVLYSTALNMQVPRVRQITTYTLPALTTSLTPATVGITDFGDYEEIEERAVGSSDRYTELDARDELRQRDMADRLLEFVWRNDTFYFIGATTARDLRITYESSGTAPTSGSVGWDNSLTFLSNYAVGVAGQRKGYDEIAQRCTRLAVGPRFDDGVIGGELYRILQPRVRSMQHVQIAPKPYTTSRRMGYRRTPFIQAQQPQGVGMAPAQFSSETGTITGTMDGVNTTFYLSYPVTSAQIFRNGVLMTQPSDVTFGANQMVFNAEQIPISGDVITALGWL